MAEIITKDSEEFKELTGWMKKIGKSLEAATARIRPAIADEHYLQGEDVCEMLHISKRTLQTLRDEGAIPYTTIGGKILYPESALYETLRKNYRNYRQYAGEPVVKKKKKGCLSGLAGYNRPRLRITYKKIAAPKYGRLSLRFFPSVG